MFENEGESIDALRNLYVQGCASGIKLAVKASENRLKVYLINTTLVLLVKV